MASILTISPTPSHPQNAGNRARIFNLLHNLREMGHDVWFVHVQREQGDNHRMREYWGKQFYPVPYASQTKDRLILGKVRRQISKLLKLSERRHRIDDWYDPSIDTVIKRLRSEKNFDAVLVEYVFFSKALENFGSQVIKIIDTHDVFTDRHQVYIDQGLSPQWFSTTAAEEKRGLERADIIIAIQEKDRDIFKGLCNRKIITYGYIVPLTEANRSAEKQKSRNKTNMLFVGSENQINVDSVNFFLRSVFPRISKTYPEAKLYLLGKVGHEFENTEGCVSLGEVDSLDEVYAMAEVVVNPVQLGTGLSIKAIEALGHAKPLVSTSSGIRGLESGRGKAFLVADDPEGFAEHIIRLFGDVEYSRQLGEQAFIYARNWNEENILELKKAFAQL